MLFRMYLKLLLYYIIFQHNSAQNCHNAMVVAFEEFNIPMIITSEDLSNPNLDEKSTLTYLSYFMKEHGPGYNLIMNWLQKILPDRQIHNLTVSLHRLSNCI